MPAQVGFGTAATILREDGRRQRLAIVGEDEASPGEGRIAYTSPMARALLGRAVGELVEIPGGEAEIVAARTDPPGRVRGRCCCGCRS